MILWMGAIADRTNTAGKYRPYLKWFAIPYGSFFMLFAAPDLNEFKLCMDYVISIKMVYTAINVPYSALMGVISPNPDDRVLYRFSIHGRLQCSAFGVLLPLIDLIGQVMSQRDGR